MAILFTDLGRLEDAAAELDAIAAHGFDDLPRDLGFLPAMANLADVCVEVGDVARAELVLERLEPYAGRNVVVGAAVLCHGSVARPMARLAALLGDEARARSLFAQALTANRAMRAMPFVAQTELEYAGLLAGGSDADRELAAELLTAAATTARTLGMSVLEGRVAAARHAQGGRKRSARV